MMVNSSSAARPELFRPALHPTPLNGWLNDPNGLIWFNGRYHQFYQYHPYSTEWGPMHWGHQSSPDLINWTEHSIALAPNANGMCFSGSIVYDKHNTSGLFSDSGGLVALYTAYTEQQKHCVDGRTDTVPHQHQALAFSADGMIWEKFANGTPILYSQGNPDFRDPKVFWHEQTSQWIMLLACGQHIEIYRSANLLDWDKSSEFGHRFGFHSKGPWECPDLFPLTCSSTQRTYWVLIVGIGDGVWDGGSGTQYFIGEFDGYTFSPLYHHDEIRWLDYGRDHYATQSFSNLPADKRIISAWVSNHQYAKYTPTQVFRGALLSPRQLSITSSALQQPRLQQRFAANLAGIFSHNRILRKDECTRPNNSWSIDTDTALIALDFSLSHGQKCHLSVYQSKDLSFTFIAEKHGVRINSTRRCKQNSVLAQHGFAHNYDVTIPTTTELSCQILLDKGIVTLIVNDEHTWTNLTYPENTRITLSLKSSDKVDAEASCLY